MSNPSLIDYGFKNPIPYTRYYCRRCKLFIVLDKTEPINDCPICNRNLININIARDIRTFRKTDAIKYKTEIQTY